MNDIQDILTRLPQFKIDALPTLTNDLGSGHFEGKSPEEDSELCLIVENRIVSLQLEKRDGADIRFKFDEDASPIHAGRSYPCVHWYFGEQIELVINRTIDWVRTRFQPSAAQVWHYEDGSKFVTPVRSTTPDKPIGDTPGGQENPTIDAGAWDHEHCKICDACICEIHGPWGYVNEQEIWACESCYDQYISKHSIAFMQQYFGKGWLTDF